MVTVCAAGAGPPRVWSGKVRSVALRVSDPALTLSVTGMMTGLSATAAPPGPVAGTVTVPEEAPAASPGVITVTVRTLKPALVDPVWGPANSQLPPLLLWKATVKFNRPELVLSRALVAGAGDARPS